MELGEFLAGQLRLNGCRLRKLRLVGSVLVAGSRSHKGSKFTGANSVSTFLNFVNFLLRQTVPLARKLCDAALASLRRDS